MEYSVKKTTWNRATTRSLTFCSDSKPVVVVLSNSASKTEIGVPRGLPRDSQPQTRTIATTLQNGMSHRPKAHNPPRFNPGPPSSVPQLPSQPPPSFVPTTVSTPPMFRPLQNPSSTLSRGNPMAASAGSVAAPSSASAQKVFGSQTGIALPGMGQSNGALGRSAQPTNTLRSGMSTSTPNISRNVPAPVRAAAPPPMRPPPPKPKIDQCRALYNYQAREADELSLAIGDVIVIVSKGTLHSNFPERF